MSYNNRQKILLLVVFSWLGIYSAVLANTKDATVVFKRWNEIQHVWHTDFDLCAFSSSVRDPFFIELFKKKYEGYLPSLRVMIPFLQHITHGQVNEQGFHFGSVDVCRAFQQHVHDLLFLIQTDMPQFIEVLKKTNFTHMLVQQADQAADQHEIANRYNQIVHLLCPFYEKNKEPEWMFAIANRFYKFCFSEQTNIYFQKLLMNKEYFPIVRFLTSVMWYNLAGCGWRHWNSESLHMVKEHAVRGDKIIYIAGGSDIYQLIKSGIYEGCSKKVEIINIDPQLPSQPKYYIDDWEWLIRGNENFGLGDKITFDFGDRKLSMVRTKFNPDYNIVFKAVLNTGNTIDLQQCTTEWTVYDDHDNPLGTYTLVRRFVRQDDFVHTEGCVYLMSLNELFYFTLPDFLNGWRIQPSAIPENFSMIVKQLDTKVTKAMLCNMRMFNLLNATDLRFIALGSCVN